MKAFDARDTTLTGETIELVKAEHSNGLGPNLELIDCEVLSKDVARGISIPGLRMKGGVWRQKTKLTKMRFSRASFNSVRFEGTFHDCMFGDHEHPERATMHDCDFREAKLSSCLFKHIEPSEIKTAAWPTIRFVDPQQFLDQLQSMDLPQKLGISLRSKAGRPDGFRLFVDDANRLAEWSGITEEALRGYLEELPGIEIRDAVPSE